MENIENKTFDMERALYGSQGIVLKNCIFDGPADGESALKECREIEASHCFFNLRYPFWHDEKLKIADSFGNDISLPCSAMVLKGYFHYRYKAAWNQSAAGMQLCENARM